MTLAAALEVPYPHDYAHDWALVDVETSGLIPRQHRVLSIAVVTLGPDGEQTGEFSTLLNPGGDSGPVHIHGLTPERLRGAPPFEQVAAEIAELLRNRVMVAHNAQFDYDFLAHEFARAGVRLPVSRRLCSLALNRRVDPPTKDMRLATLAAHYGVPQTRAHDALDDTRVLAGVFRASLKEAAKLDLRLPMVTCPPRQNSHFTPNPPKAPCAYRNPGRLASGGPLIQGMKIAITGETGIPRAELVSRSVAAGLNMVGSVSRHTSALVANGSGAGSAKARRAATEGVPVIDERTYLGLLGGVRPGTAHGSQSAGVSTPAQPQSAAAFTATAAAVTAPPAPRRPQSAAGRPLSGRRVLVLGGTHPQAVAARTRVVELGASAAVNLSASVTDAVILAGGEQDRRMRRIVALELPTHDADWLIAPTSSPPNAGGGAPGQAAHVLPRGGVVDLPRLEASHRWNVTASWAQQTSCEIDVVAFTVDEEDQVAYDDDFTFYGAPECPNGAVRLLSDGPTEQTISMELAALPPAALKVVIAAAIDGTPTFGDVGAIQITTAQGASALPLSQATLDAATTERTMLLAEIYRRGPIWRFRAVGQGYDHGLEHLARGYGVDIAD